MKTVCEGDDEAAIIEEGGMCLSELLEKRKRYGGGGLELRN
jgi:hypothetical protein